MIRAAARLYRERILPRLGKAVDVAAGRITNERTGLTYEAAPFPPFMQELIAAGGLVPYVRKRLGLA